MLQLFNNTSLTCVKNKIDNDESIIIEGNRKSTIVMYTFLIKPQSKRVLVYQRPETYFYEDFRNLYSIGFGGAIEIEDILLDDNGDVAKFDTIVDSGLREVEEELYYDGDRFTKEDVTFVGLITDGQMAFICAIEVDEGLEVKVAEPENVHVGWMSIDELWDKRDLLEPWSRYILDDFLRIYNVRSSMESSNVEWKSIPGYSKYMASRCGKIKNLTTGRISEGGKAGRYLKVSVYPDGESKPHLEYLHILICKTFHGPGKKGQVVKHKNNMRFDCSASNLEWSTQSDNIQEAYDDGLVPGKGANSSSRSK